MSDLASLHRADLDRTGSAEFVAFARCLMASNGRLAEAVHRAQQTRLTERVVSILKDAATAGTTTDTTWAAGLAAYQQIASGFLGSLEKFSAFDAILNAGAFARLPLHTRVVVTSTAATGDVVAEGGAKSVTLGFHSGATRGAKGGCDFSFERRTSKSHKPCRVHSNFE